RFNIVRHAALAFTIADGRSDAGGLAQSAKSISIHDDLFDDIDRASWDPGASSWMFYLGTCPDCRPIRDISIRHVTVVSTNDSFLFLGTSGNPVRNLVFSDNILQNGRYGLVGCGMSGIKTIKQCAPGAALAGNLVVGGSDSDLPGKNFFPPS